MFNRKNRLLLLKLLSLFSVVRGYNVFVIALAQYLASIYILAPELPLREVLFDFNLFVIVLSSTLVIAAGYIINNFYDAEKDLINKPRKSMLDRLVSQQFKLITYFVLNFLATFAASYVSFKAVLFFSAYIFGIWFYSHKLKKIPFIGNFVSATLAITPFFAVFVYYKNFDTVIFVHALFLFTLILSREMIKDLENIAGDMAQNYKTVPILYGQKFSKTCISLLLLLALLPTFLLTEYFDVGHMHFYFLGCIVMLVVVTVMMWKARTKLHYVGLHNMIKLIIVAGVFSILLIDIDLVLNRIL
ncbi:geranylgeranylglycerol-phosphate geranylgeranyltransferase [Cytophaga sp. FL35]|uniref:geranylgeranylglycerol-phosphate geranylgeranyltransferase n=1 Tax=Cytophaga sp. FL35 TaxID=1904456 RepID=UPI0016535B84|nr:geranylgeranylglycerol-phosphate geranylgeranyltransferase [Cytophaga sp. FL35]MBC6999015.1 geranylgeranylglycerol-phosphate geranylgeranyltransferase [Cytophaga sp. FL35]